MDCCRGWAGDALSSVRSNPGWHFARRRSELGCLAAIHWHFPNHSISSFITSESRFPLGCWHCRCSTACGIGHLVSGRIEESRQTIIWLSVISSLCSRELIFAHRIATNSRRSEKTTLRKYHQSLYVSFGTEGRITGQRWTTLLQSTLLRLPGPARRYPGQQASIKAMHH